MMLDNKKIFSISDVSAISGFSAYTLRFYEKIGLNSDLSIHLDKE